METKNETDEFFSLKIFGVLVVLGIIGYLAFGNAAPTNQPSQDTTVQMETPSTGVDNSTSDSNTNGTNDPNNNSLSSTQLDAMQTQIQQFKQNLPIQIDSETTMVDVEFTQPNTITYYETLSNSGNWETLTNYLLKTSALSKICSNQEYVNFLNEGINLDFSYSVIDSPQTFFFALTKDDCPSD